MQILPLFRSFRSLPVALLLGIQPMQAEEAKAPENPEGATPAPSVIAFGSCAKEKLPQPIWDKINAQEPDLFLFLGDNIYGDTEDVAELRKKYALLGAKEGYKKLLAQCPVMATWDDHDFGKNDAGVEFGFKDVSQEVFLDFFGVPKDSPRRARKGIYHAETFGEDGGPKLQVIMLDTRYFRSSLKRGAPGPYAPDPDPAKTMLGEEQWKWLEKKLMEPADLRIIGSSIQVISEEHGWEKWGNLPLERAKLMNLIKKTKAGGVIFLSGDRHMGDISMIPADNPAGVGYSLFDLTSSGMNQGGGGAVKEPNKWRVGEENYRRKNFGTIHIDWDAEDPVIEMAIRDGDGEVAMSASAKLSELRPKKR